MALIQILGTDNQVRPQTGNENNLLLSAPENLEPGSQKIEWPWKVHVGPKWHGLLSPWGRLLEAGGGGSIPRPMRGTWPADTVVNTPVFVVKGTLIIANLAPPSPTPP